MFVYVKCLYFRILTIKLFVMKKLIMLSVIALGSIFSYASNEQNAIKEELFLNDNVDQVTPVEVRSKYRITVERYVTNPGGWVSVVLAEDFIHPECLTETQVNALVYQVRLSYYPEFPLVKYSVVSRCNLIPFP